MGEEYGQLFQLCHMLSINFESYENKYFNHWNDCQFWRNYRSEVKFSVEINNIVISSEGNIAILETPYKAMYAEIASSLGQ